MAECDEVGRHAFLEALGIQIAWLEAGRLTAWPSQRNTATGCSSPAESV